MAAIRRRDEAAHGEERTERVTLDIYDAMQRAMDSGAPYVTRLGPPPAAGRGRRAARPLPLG